MKMKIFVPAEWAILGGYISAKFIRKLPSDSNVDATVVAYDENPALDFTGLDYAMVVTTECEPGDLLHFPNPPKLSLVVRREEPDYSAGILKATRAVIMYHYGNYRCADLRKRILKELHDSLGASRRASGPHPVAV